MASISFSVMNNLTSDTLRVMHGELVARVEALRADDIRPTKGVVNAIREINNVLSKREGF